MPVCPDLAAAVWWVRPCAHAAASTRRFRRVTVSRAAPQPPKLQPAMAALRAGAMVEAERHLRRLLRQYPDHAETLHCLGIALHGQGEHVQALGFLDRALRANPLDSRAENNRATVLTALNRTTEALASLDRALCLQPHDPELHYNRGNTLLALNRAEEALAAFNRALELNPKLQQARQNRGIALTRLGRSVEALADFDRLLADPAPGVAVPELRANRAGTLDQLNRRADALADCDVALAQDPNFALAHWNAAIVCLGMGDFARGWREWEWRWKTPDFARDRKRWPQEPWLGQAPLAGRRILLHSDQGLGDMIQFCRYVPRVKALGAETILECPPPLLELMRTLDGVDHLITVGEDPGDVTFQTPLMSLPLAFGTELATIPAATPYLAADPARVAAWAARLGPSTRPRIGLAWSGNPMLKTDAQRSAPLASLANLILADVSYISVQKDVRERDRAALSQLGIADYGADITDFADSAALISLLDVVICVDTGPAHLAGAIGKPVWLLLHNPAEWRWLMDREDSPWYPTARLFRQVMPGDWPELALRVRHEQQRFFGS